MSTYMKKKNGFLSRNYQVFSKLLIELVVT